MNGRMMRTPLSIGALVERAATYFGAREIVGPAGRTTYAAVCERAARLASGLARLGIQPGDRVATLMWNHVAHLECYLAVPGMGAVLHTLNARLPPEDLAYIASHAGDVAILVDPELAPLIEGLRVRHVIVDHEALVASGGERAWPRLDEDAAAMLCYTSGTTGRPKGVAYSHRSMVLHALMQGLPDQLGVAARDVAMPIVPMFHAAAWGMPYVAAMTGAKLVLPGRDLSPANLVGLVERERVTLTAAVPTVWAGILELLDAAPGRYDLSSLRMAIVGGAAAPPSLVGGLRDRHGVVLTQSWGMTELGPMGTMAWAKPTLDDAGARAARASQGLPAPLVELRHVDGGRVLPRDGRSAGELEVRGPSVAASYMGGDGADRFTGDGWFRTGDIVTIDPEGYVRITDRTKDVIKSGGEWISSVAVEHALQAHPAVREAAVFAAEHPKWSERPVAAIVLREGAAASRDDLHAHLAPLRFARPDAYVFVEELPRTGTGKIQKEQLRRTYGRILLEAG